MDYTSTSPHAFMAQAYLVKHRDNFYLLLSLFKYLLRQQRNLTKCCSVLLVNYAVKRTTYLEPHGLNA
jgi:hypothetical protein